MKRDFVGRLGSTIFALLCATLLTSVAPHHEASANDFVVAKQKKIKCEPLELMPTPVDFANVNIGSTGMVTVKVTNPASNPAVDVVTIVAKKSPPFGVSGECGTLQPGGMCQLTVTFSPTKKGKAVGELEAAYVGCPDSNHGKASKDKLEGTGVVGPTASPSPTRSSTPTPSATPTISPTPTQSSSQTPTATASASVSPSPTPTPTASPSPSVSPKPTASPTPSISPTPSVSPTASPTASPTPLPVSYGNCKNTLTLQNNIQHPGVGAAGNYAVVGGDNGTDVFYSVSTDNGVTWSGPIKITNNSGNDTATNPQVVVDFINQVPFSHFLYQRRDSNGGHMTYLQIELDNGHTVRGPIDVLGLCIFPSLAVDAARNNVFAACGDLGNDVFMSESFNGGTFSSEFNPFNPSALGSLPGLAINQSGGVVITAQGTDSSGNPAVFGTFAPDGATFGQPFKVYSADANDSLASLAPNTFIVGNNLIVTADETSSSTGFLVNVFGDYTAPTPVFSNVRVGQTQVGQKFIFTPAACLTNPGALSIAEIARNGSNNVPLVQSPDLTNPSAYTLTPLDMMNDFQVAAGCTPKQGVFAIVPQGTTMNVYTCPAQ